MLLNWIICLVAVSLSHVSAGGCHITSSICDGCNCNRGVYDDIKYWRISSMHTFCNCWQYYWKKLNNPGNAKFNIWKWLNIDSAHNIDQASKYWHISIIIISRYIDKYQNLWMVYTPLNSPITKIKLANSVELTNHQNFRALSPATITCHQDILYHHSPS